MKYDFSIENSKEMFQILSKNLYSKPVESMIRELCANAYDAEIALGKEPSFQIGWYSEYSLLGTEDLKNTFRIRDYGAGLSESEIAVNYTSFFYSSKKGDNSQTGAFGLGSKSPFAITDCFYVISYNKGIKKVYKMEVTETAPSCEKIEEIETDENSGLEIFVPFGKGYGYGDFLAAYSDFLRGFLHMPKVFSDSHFQMTRTYDTGVCFKDMEEGLHVEKEEEITSTINVVYGVTKYTYSDIDSSLKVPFTKFFFHAFPHGLTLVLKPTEKSQVSLTPSRENLHFDSKTCEYIEEKLKKYLKDFLSKKDPLKNPEDFKVLNFLGITHYLLSPDNIMDDFTKNLYERIEELHSTMKNIMLFRVLYTESNYVRFRRIIDYNDVNMERSLVYKLTNVPQKTLQTLLKRGITLYSKPFEVPQSISKICLSNEELSGSIPEGSYILVEGTSYPSFFEKSVTVIDMGQLTNAKTTKVRLSVSDKEYKALRSAILLDPSKCGVYYGDSTKRYITPEMTEEEIEEKCKGKDYIVIDCQDDDELWARWYYDSGAEKIAFISEIIKDKIFIIRKKIPSTMKNSVEAKTFLHEVLKKNEWFYSDFEENAYKYFILKREGYECRAGVKEVMNALTFFEKDNKVKKYFQKFQGDLTPEEISRADMWVKMMRILKIEEISKVLESLHDFYHNVCAQDPIIGMILNGLHNSQDIELAVKAAKKYNEILKKVS